MRVRNEATFKAFRKVPRFRVIVSDNTMLLAENLGQALSHADTMKFFGKHCTIEKVGSRKAEV